MAFSIYESISNNQTIPVNVFAVPVQSSTFHWHNEYELVGVLKGSIILRVGSEEVKLKQGDIFLINPNVIHAIRECENEPNLCMFVQMSRELFVLEEQEDTETRFYLDSTGDTLIADLFDYVVYDVRFGDLATRNDQELTVAIIEFMEQHLEEEKIVELTCRKFGLSRKSLDRNLKMTLGTTGKEMIENLRIEKTKNLLKNTSKNMNYILDACGFGSEKTFYRVFREETGVTPNVFRQRGQVDHYDEALKGYLDYETAELKKILKTILEG